MYATDYAIIQHLSSLLFDGDTTRIIYASNAYAFRKRADKETGNLNLPFVNFHLSNYMPGERLRWHGPAYSQGVYVPELEEKVQFAPITLDYEASFWCYTDFDVKYAFSEFIWDTDNKTILAPSVVIKEQDVLIPAHLSYDGLDLNPEYNEQDWLERNKIHSASIDFQIETLALKSNTDITLTEEVVFNLAYSQGIEAGSFDETYTKLVDHFTEATTLQ